MAVSEGGMAEGNATLVYQESVTYLGQKRISLVLVFAGTAVAGVLILLLSCVVIAVRHRLSLRPHLGHKRLEPGQNEENSPNVKKGTEINGDCP